MPRPKKPKDHSTSWGEDTSFKLTEKNREDLLSIIGMGDTTRIAKEMMLSAKITPSLLQELAREANKPKEMLSCVELLLGQYSSMEEALDNKPRPATILEEIKPIKKLIEKLMERLNNLSASSKTIYSVGGTRSILETEDAVKKNLATLYDGIKETEGRYQKIENRHAQKKEAVRRIAVELFRIFNHYNTSDAINGAENFVIDGLKCINVEEPSKRILTEARQAADKSGDFIPDVHEAGKVLHAVVCFNLNNK